MVFRLLVSLSGGGRRDEEMVRSYFGALDAQMGLLVDRVPGR